MKVSYVSWRPPPLFSNSSFTVKLPASSNVTLNSKNVVWFADGYIRSFPQLDTGSFVISQFFVVIASLGSLDSSWECNDACDDVLRCGVVSTSTGLTAKFVPLRRRNRISEPAFTMNNYKIKVRLKRAYLFVIEVLKHAIVGVVELCYKNVVCLGNL